MKIIMRDRVCIVLLFLFFLGGAMNHSIGFGGKAGGWNTQIWHGFYLAANLTGLLAILYRGRLAYCWLLTIFIWQIPVEIRGAILTLKEDTSFLQLIEPGLNILGLICVRLAKDKFLRS